jgi:hypothetical protein
MSKNRNQNQNKPQQKVEVATTVEEYIPSANQENYPNIEVPSYSYKILAYKNDYIRLQDEVTKHLNEGWELAGGLSTTLHADSYSTVTIFGQAVYKKSN